MQVVILSGGSGTRLWPLSNGIRSKQFLKVFEHEGAKESMIQRMCRMLKETVPDVEITVATSAAQVPQIKNQLGSNANISVEPSRRDTFPAIVLACAFLKKHGISEDEPIVICPVDPDVEEGYFRCLRELGEQVATDQAKLTLMGIEPEYPAECYGYILREGNRVRGFIEKPFAQDAAAYIENGALWNGGVFGFRLGYVLDIARKRWGFDAYDELLAQYDSLEIISFDYAVAEKESLISVIPYSGKWKDIGSWDAFSDAIALTETQNATIAGCHNTTAINELLQPLVVLGIDNAIVAATPDGILVADKQSSQQIKQHVHEKRPMYEQRPWGEYQVLDYSMQQPNGQMLTKHLTIHAGSHISYQRHQNRTETWTIVQGHGQLILEDEVSSVSAGDVVAIKAGMKHAILAESELHIIEVQLGTQLSEEDIERLDYCWDERTE